MVEGLGGNMESAIIYWIFIVQWNESRLNWTVRRTILKRLISTIVNAMNI